MRNFLPVALGVVGFLRLCIPGFSGERFEENFNFGVLDQNTVMEVDPAFIFNVTTNGNGKLYISTALNGPPQATLRATFTSVFEVIGDFTNRVTVYNGSGGFPVLGTKIFTGTGWCSVESNAGNTFSRKVSLPSLSTNKTFNAPFSPPATLEIRRVGGLVSLGYFEATGAYHGMLLIDEPAMRVPVKVQLYAASPGDLARGGSLDDWAISAQDLSPDPAPRLFTTITPSAFQISWPSFTNRQYQVWYRTALDPNAWLPLGAAVDGTGFMMSTEDGCRTGEAVLSSRGTAIA